MAEYAVVKKPSNPKPSPNVMASNNNMEYDYASAPDAQSIRKPTTGMWTFCVLCRSGQSIVVK